MLVLPMAGQATVTPQLRHRIEPGATVYYLSLPESMLQWPDFDFVGTGGALTEHFLSSRAGGYAIMGVEPRTARAPQLVRDGQLPDCAGMMTLVKDTFGRSMTRLAEVFGVSRQTLYNWMRGELPKAQHQARLRELAAAAEVLRSEGIVATPPLLGRVVSRGRPLLELVAEQGDGADAARKLVSIVRRSERERTRLAATSKGRKSRPGRADMGLVALDERS